MSTHLEDPSRLSRASRILALALLATPAVPAAAQATTELFDYRSSISVDSGGALDLKAQLDFDQTATGQPIAVVMHSYSNPNGHFSTFRRNAQWLQRKGFFAIMVAMRGREGSDGTRDSGGLEIYDIYDAVEAVKADPRYSGLIDPSNVHITGYSGGGGNVMSALTKFPDYFRLGSSFFGMSDYGFDPVDGWYVKGAGGRTSQLDLDIGNPTTGDPDVLDRYHARASNLASRNNPYSEIHLFVNETETISPPVNSISYRDNARAAESFAGEFDNITLHLGRPGLYEDFDGDGVDERGEEQNWPHSAGIAQQEAGEGWYTDRLLAGDIPEPQLNDTDDLFVAGWVRTKAFELFLGDGQNAAADLAYQLSDTELVFEFELLSNNSDITGVLSAETQRLGATYSVELNGVTIEEDVTDAVYRYEGLQSGDRLRLIAVPEPNVGASLFCICAFSMPRRVTRKRS